MKHYIKLVLLGVCIGIVSMLIQHAFHIEEDVFLLGYWSIAITIILLVVLFHTGYHLLYFKKMKHAIQLLEACKPQEYIEAMEHLLQTAKGKELKKVLRLNLTAGYCDLKEYEKALQILESMDNGKLKGGLQLVHHLNLCICYFYTGQIEKAMTLYQIPKESFSIYRKHPDSFTQYFFSLDILAAIATKDLRKADTLLKQAEETWHDPRSQKMYTETRSLLLAQKKETNG